MNSAPMEKPTDRARGGMASDRLDSTPGPTMARQATMRELAAIATHRRGAVARTIDRVAARSEAAAMKRNTWLGPRARAFIPMRAPTARPTSSTSCTGMST